MITVFDNESKMLALPSIEVTINDKEYLFLIDTGSNVSHIDKEIASKEDELKNESDIIGISGNTTTLSHAAQKMIISGQGIGMMMYISDLNGISQSLGKRIYGILGTDFLYETKAIIDFRDEVLLWEIS